MLWRDFSRLFAGVDINGDIRLDIERYYTQKKPIKMESKSIQDVWAFCYSV